MFSIDDRAGNVITTVALFMAAVAVLYLARGAFLILLLSILFAYLLDPAVTWVQQHSRLGRQNRTWAIAQVFLVGMLVLGGIGYEFGPHLSAQLKALNAAVPEILHNFSGERTVVTGGAHVLDGEQQARIRELLARHQDVIRRVFERGAASLAYVAASAIWLLAIPILALFILQDGRDLAGGFVKTLDPRGDRTRVERILRRVDTMLARYVRAQLALAGLSFVFYSVTMFALGFPYAIALALVGSILEFLPAVGWIASAAAILTVGFLAHAHWIWMALLLVVWRFVQAYVNSPRILGSTLELQPLTVVFALMVGGQVGGIAGLYLSVPAVAVLRIVWLESFRRNPSTALSTPTLMEVQT